MDAAIAAKATRAEKDFIIQQKFVKPVVRPNVIKMNVKESVAVKRDRRCGEQRLEDEGWRRRVGGGELEER